MGLTAVGAKAGSEVGADEKLIAGEKLCSQVSEDVAGVFGGEVADAGADVEGQGACVGKAIEGEGLGGVVGNLTSNGDARDISSDVFSGGEEGGLGDVDGLVNDCALTANSSGQKDAGLSGSACA